MEDNENHILQKVKEEIDTDSHQQRVLELKQRQVLMDEEQSRLRNYLMHASPIEEAAAREQLASVYGYEMKGCEDYTVVSQGNTPYCQLFVYNNQRTNRMRILARVYWLRHTTERFHFHLLNESMKIWRYFSELECWSTFSLKVYDMLKADNCLFVFHERFQPANSLKNRLWNSEHTIEQMGSLVKGWTVQVADAIDILNLTGVAHRFIRLENVLVGSDQRVKLTNFDVACLNWTVSERQPIRQNRGLPPEISKPFWNHLPPECFDEDGYDASMVDVWSVGTVICEMLTKNIPMDFEAISSSDPTTGLIPQWNQSWERKIITEDFRTLLDDIFKDADNRMTILDLKKDIRLRYPTNILAKVRQNPYYRIDLNKNLNVNECDLKRHKSGIAKQMSWSDFSKNSTEIFNLPSFKVAQSEEALQILGYHVKRADSFGPEFGAAVKNDFYLKATVRDDPNCLAKIFLMSRLPIRHRNMLLNESSKVMRYFTETDTCPPYVHRILDIFYCDLKLFIFYENLLNYRSIGTLMQQHQQQSCGKNSLQASVRHWMSQLGELVSYMAHHGVSHRYIRPEYVFITDSSTVKLAHFDMACFVWNPIKMIQVLRHRGLQDENNHLWDHLPPESFEEKYDSLLADVWSLGVLLVYCLTKEKPFVVPFTYEEAQAVWRYFRSKFAGILHNQLDLLDKIFTNYDQRIRPAALAQRLAVASSTTSNSNIITANHSSGNSTTYSTNKRPLCPTNKQGYAAKKATPPYENSNSTSYSAENSSGLNVHEEGGSSLSTSNSKATKTPVSSPTSSSSSSTSTSTSSPQLHPPTKSPRNGVYSCGRFKPPNRHHGNKPASTGNNPSCRKTNQDKQHQGHQQLLNSMTKATKMAGANQTKGSSRSKLSMQNNRFK